MGNQARSGNPTRSARRTPEYEFFSVTLPRGTSRSAARQLLTDHAEYGHWEIDRLRRYPDGTRKVTLRRRILRVPRPQVIVGTA